MSEVAVKIYETKREVHRISLASPLYGKNGDSQVGKWIDADTGKEVQKLVLQRTGHYEISSTMIGTDLYDIAGPLLDDEKGMLCIKTEVLQSSTRTYHDQEKYFVPQPNYELSFDETIEGFQSSTVLKHYYITIRYLDE